MSAGYCASCRHKSPPERSISPHANFCDCSKYIDACTSCKKVKQLWRKCTSRGVYCIECLTAENFKLCQKCLRYSDDIKFYLCPHCRENDPLGDWRASPTYLTEGFGTKLGVELEFATLKTPNATAKEIYQICNYPDFFFVQHDGSIRDVSGTPGVEIVSSPLPIKYHYNLWNWLEKIEGLSVNRGCAMHINVDKSELSSLAVGKLIRFMNSSENYPFIRALAGRYSERYAPINTSLGWASGLSFKDKEKLKSQRKKWRSGPTPHYSMLCVKAYCVEFRMFEGTLDIEKLLRNLEFTLSLVYFIRQTSVQDLRSFHYTEYMYNKRKSYPRITQWLKQGGYV